MYSSANTSKKTNRPTLEKHIKIEISFRSTDLAKWDWFYPSIFYPSIFEGEINLGREFMIAIQTTQQIIHPGIFSFEKKNSGEF